MQRFEAELHQNRGGDGDRRSEPGCAFKKRAEGKGDENNLDTRIGRERGQAAAQHAEQSFLHRELIEKDQVENDPADGEQSVSRSEKRRGGSGLGRHLVNKQGNSQRDGESGQRREMNTNPKNGNGAEQHDDRQRRDNSGKKRIPQRIVILQPMFHARCECRNEKRKHCGKSSGDSKSVARAVPSPQPSAWDASLSTS